MFGKSSFLDLEPSTTVIHANSVSFLTYLSTIMIEFRTVRVKSRMSLRNGMWHGLRNDIIMRNVIYGNGAKK